MSAVSATFEGTAGRLGSAGPLTLHVVTGLFHMLGLPVQWLRAPWADHPRGPGNRGRASQDLAWEAPECHFYYSLTLVTPSQRRDQTQDMEEETPSLYGKILENLNHLSSNPVCFRGHTSLTGSSIHGSVVFSGQTTQCGGDKAIGDLLWVRRQYSCLF